MARLNETYCEIVRVQTLFCPTLRNKKQTSVLLLLQISAIKTQNRVEALTHSLPTPPPPSRTSLTFSTMCLSLARRLASAPKSASWAYILDKFGLGLQEKKKGRQKKQSEKMVVKCVGGEKKKGKSNSNRVERLSE